MIGQLVGGRFRVTGVLGEGGMGIVYEGEQQMGTTVRKVAIKTLHQHLSKDPGVVARFNRECATVVALEHPNTIKFYDFGTTADGALYIAMEFVRGRPLSQVIEHEGPLSTERVLKIMRQVCGALEEAHRQNVIHRDLKPDNIILAERAGEADFVKVLDFGIAARTESADAEKEQKLTQQGMVLGTPPYMSPEQFTGKSIDARSDIYSLGVMVYEMLTGNLPFEANTPWQWATEHMTAQPKPFEVVAPAAEIPASMKQAVMRALAKDSAQRQKSAREFFEELSQAATSSARGSAADAVAKTAAMEQAPDFSAMHAGPSLSHGGEQGLGNMVTPPAVAQVPMAPSRPRSKGGKGLILGLGVVGVALLVAIAVVAARSLKPVQEPLAEPIATGESQATGVATIAPEVDPGVGTAATAAPSEPEAAGDEPSAAKKPASTSKNTTPTAKKPAETQEPSGSTGSDSKPATDVKPNNEDKTGAANGACDACSKAVAAGNLSGAAQSYVACSDAAAKAQCQNAARRAAPRLIVLSARNGRCDQARAIAQAAEAMGAGSPQIARALKSCN